MTMRISKSIKVSFTPEQMYDLVNDVEAYPRYLPMCSAVNVLQKSQNHLKATITLSKGKIKLSLTTANTMEVGRRIQMNLVDGPFKCLRGVWSFEPGDGGHGCQASFNLEFEFSNALLSMAFGGFFQEVAESMVDLFSKQAAYRYGSPVASVTA